MPPPTRLILVGPQRSGTSVTATCIAAHPGAAMSPAEVLVNPFFTRGVTVMTTGHESFEQRRRAALPLFDLVAAGSAIDPDTAPAVLGIKSALSTEAEAADLCNAARAFYPDARFIVVRRGDLVAQFASLALARQTGTWHSAQPGEADTTPQLTLPEDEFVTYLAEQQRVMAHLLLLRETHALLELRYEEDILAGIRADKIFDFLGLSRRGTETWMHKVAPPAEHYVANYDALRGLARSTTVDLAPESLRAFAHQRLIAWALKQHPDSCGSWIRHCCESGQHQVAYDTAVQLLRAARHSPMLERQLFEAIEVACDRLASVDHARRALAALADRYDDTPYYLVLNAQERRHAGELQGAVACLRRALELETEHERAAQLLSDWSH